MAKNSHPEDLSEQELRRLLLNKRRASRHERLERFRRTGRVVNLAPDLSSSLIEERRTKDIPRSEDTSLGSASATMPRQRWLDRMLLGVEVLAALGLVVLLVVGLNMFLEFNAEFAAALQQATLEPTPLITAVVLPSGHTPPNDQGGVLPNESEIPEHLLPLYQSLANIPVPTVGPEHAVRVQIPAIEVDAPVENCLGRTQHTHEHGYSDDNAVR